MEAVAGGWAAMTTTKHVTVSMPMVTRRRGPVVGAPSTAASTLDGAQTQRGHTTQTARHISIDRLILHGVDNRSATPQLVDEPVALTDDVRAFFAQYIEAAAQRADWRARFSDADGNVPQLCRALLEPTPRFVEASQELAKHLFAQMRSRSIAPGDFAVVTYAEGNEPPCRVALLKLDPDQRLARNYSTSGGHRHVSIAAAANLLPTIDHLQKCALLVPATAPDPSSGRDPHAPPFEVHLLDTQVRTRDATVAAFFHRNFLTTDLEPSPRRHTREFLRVTTTWLGSAGGDLSPAALLRFYRARRASLQAPFLHLGSFGAAALPEHPALAADLLQHLQVWRIHDALDTSGFTVDPGAAAPALADVTLELDYGARLTIPAEHFADLVRIAPERTADNTFRLVIESVTLREARA